jgi:hypothetical protein
MEPTTTLQATQNTPAQKVVRKTLLTCGILAPLLYVGSDIVAAMPTPWLGVRERINIYGYMLWVAVLAIVLLREKKSAAIDGSNA